MNILSHVHRKRFQSTATAQPERTEVGAKKESLGSVQVRVVPCFSCLLEIRNRRRFSRPDKVGRDTVQQRDARSSFILCQWPIG